MTKPIEAISILSVCSKINKHLVEVGNCTDADQSAEGYFMRKIRVPRKNIPIKPMKLYGASEAVEQATKQ